MPNSQNNKLKRNRQDLAFIPRECRRGGWGRGRVQRRGEGKEELACLNALMGVNNYCSYFSLHLVVLVGALQQFTAIA